jgi:hypothetical protein
MIRFIVFTVLALGIATSAQAMSPPPLHQPDGIRADVGYRGVARGHRYGVARGYGVRRYGVARGYGVRRYGYGGYGHYRYRGYGAYRPGFGVARRQVRRCALWGVGHVCRRWY